MSLNTIYDAVLRGDAKTAAADTQTALDEGISPHKVLHEACMPAMSEVGRQFEAGDKFIPEMMIAARAMQSAVDILKPLLVAEDVEVVGTIVIGTVAGDLHDIGKNLVGMMMEGAGFQIIDLGSDVAPETFVKAVQENDPDLLGMSALLTTTMPSITATMEALAEAGVRDKVKVIIGGAPITQDFADKVGADGFAGDAGSAPRVAKALLGVDS
jgi:5-methyltetrahydrofolate--homocysteine methyltransferase